MERMGSNLLTNDLFGGLNSNIATSTQSNLNVPTPLDQFGNVIPSPLDGGNNSKVKARVKKNEKEKSVTNSTTKTSSGSNWSDGMFIFCGTFFV